MNERIKEIAKQAQLGAADFGNDQQYYVGTQESFVKFAELIVIECANVCFNSGMEKSEAHGQAVLYHFGI